MFVSNRNNLELNVVFSHQHWEDRQFWDKHDPEFNRRGTMWSWCYEIGLMETGDMCRLDGY